MQFKKRNCCGKPESISQTLIVWRYLDHIFELKEKNFCNYKESLARSYEDPGWDPISIPDKILHLSGCQ